MDKKPRTHQVMVGHAEKFQAVRRHGDGRVEIQTLVGEWTTPDRVFTESGYDRDSGKRKSTTYIAGAAAHPNLLDYLRSFDVVFAIDTNTKTINGTAVASSCAYKVSVGNESGEGVEVAFGGPLFLRFKNGQPELGLDEKLSILLIVSQIKRLHAGNLRIAIITDHDLVHHGAFNTHTSPFYKDQFLPQSVTLLYASGDHTNKNDNVMTFALSMCDKAANEDLLFFKETGIFPHGSYAVPVEQLIDVHHHDGRISF